MDFLSSLLSSALANFAVLPFTGKKKSNVKKEADNQSGAVSAPLNFGRVAQTTNNTTNIHHSQGAPVFKFRESENSYIKTTARILFVDDQDQSSTIRNLGKLGWKNAEQLPISEALNTDSEAYRHADLVFVDFSGVGPARGGQGLSVLSSLNSKYGRKKFYVLYTAHAKRITLEKLEESGLPIRENIGWSQLSKASADYILETTMLNGLRQIEQ